MKKSFMILSTLVFALLLPVLAGSAPPAQITFISVTGNWHDPVDNVPGSQPGQPVITNGVPTSRINWGVTSGSQSGYDFSRTIPGAQTLPPAPTPFFPLGTFTHRNFTVSDPSLRSVQLDVVLVLNVDGVQTGPLNFTFTFNHVETPNNPTPPATCPYPTPSGEGCTDRVTFVSAPQPTTFNVGGVDYTLSMSFVENGIPVAEFITREGRINTANLVGQFTLPPTPAAPVLVVTKAGPATMNLGQLADFVIDVQNTGLSNAWDVTIRDQFPDGTTGGMCDMTPEILSAQVFAANGAAVPGKGPLSAGSGYAMSYSAAPNCRLDLTMLAAAAAIGPNERLIIRYRTQLDANTQNGVALTNVAGATQWFNGNSSTPNRQTYTRTLTNGTVGTADHEDPHTVTTALTGYLFEKTVANMTSGVNPTTTAAPGDTLRYTLRFRNTNQPLNNFRMFDELDALNAQAAFMPGTLTLVNSPAGANITSTSGTGGAKGTGVIDIRNLNVAANAEVQVQFDIRLATTLSNGTVVVNQSVLRLANGTAFATSDDPNISGTANPTRVTIVTTPPPSSPDFRIHKVSTDRTGDPNVLLAGETLRYTLTVKNIGEADTVNTLLRDAVPASTTYVAGSTTLNGVAVADVAGVSRLVNGMLIHSPANATPGAMPADASSNPANVATITFDVVVNANVAAGTVISNQGFVTAAASGIVDQPSDDPDTPAANDPTRDTVGGLPAAGYIFEKTVANPTSGMNPVTTAAPGDKLRYTLRFRTTNQALSNFSIVDEVDALNAQALFAPGTLTLVSSPAGADISATSGTGGSKGTGVIDIRNLDVAANGEILIQFDITLKAAIANGTVVTNQSTLGIANGTTFALSDDPNVSGTTDPTRVTIASSPAFRVQKFSTDRTDDPNILLAGETLRYTLTVKNIGNVDAMNTVLRDAVPANTTYVAGSTTLNGVAVADVAGVSPLVNGMLIHSPANTTPGSMPADASSNPANLANIGFDVVVNANVAAGTVISNQGFVTSITSGIVNQPSDDPETPDPNDPTRDTVGGLPATGYIFEKTVANLTSGVNPVTTAAPGDKLRYILRVRTTNQALSNFSIVDEVDALNAQAVFAPATLTLVSSPAGADISATSFTGGSKGTGVIDIRNLDVAANGEILIQFDITLKAAIANGTVVTNQSTLRLANGTTFALSDDPNVNGTANPQVSGDEDPTRVTIVVAPPTVPNLVVTKTGPATMNQGQWGDFVIDVQNTGLGNAWDVIIRDQFPDGTTGGMCDMTPEILSAQVFAANGTTPVPGKGPLTAGSGYSLSYSAAPGCRLDLTMLTAAAAIGANERLIIRYRTQLDTNTQNGVALTNVAGAIQWFNADSSNGNRVSYTRTLTNGTPGTADHEDDHTVTSAVSGYFFEKTVTKNGALTSTALPGDTLRYTLRFRSTGQALGSFRIFDDLDALNAQAAFMPGTLALVTSPAGADISATNGTGGTKGTGVIDIRNLSLPINSEVLIQFDITLKSALSNGTIVTNQSALRLASGADFALSDDPNVNGTANPLVTGDEDPTRVTIVSAPSFLVQKISTDLTGDPNILLVNETLRYIIAVKNIGNVDALNAVLRDAVPANTSYVAGSTTLNGAAVPDVAGLSPLVNGMPINSAASSTPGSMPADAPGQVRYCWLVEGVPYCRFMPPTDTHVATITFDVVVNPNVPGGTIISNQGFVSATGIVEQPSDDPDTPIANDPTRDTVGGAAAAVLVVTKSGPATMNLGQWGDFIIDVQNTALGTAWDVTIRDQFPDGATGGMCDMTPEILSAQVFASDGVTPVPGKGPLTVGSGYSRSYNAASCRLDITMLTAAATISANERLIIRYRTQLDTNTQSGIALTNVAGAIQWFNADSSNANRLSYTRMLTNGTAGTPDHEDDHTVTSAPTGYIFEKTVVKNGALTSTAAPGDTLRYTLRFRTTGQALSDFRIFDDLDALNAQAAFMPGTLALVTSPAGADISATSNTGGSKGSGVIDIRNLNVAANSEVLIQFDVRLATTLTNGTVVANQSALRLANGTDFALSDDPNVNGAANPQVSGDEDPTRVTIVSAPSFRVQKISTDLTGDPNTLIAGETLRYSITVKNIGNNNAAGVVLRDSVPVNTAYVAGSTRLNGTPVADSGGLSPLVNGMPIHSPADATPGVMPADASSSTANVATITFDVVVNPNVSNGTVISNQGFVSASANGIVDLPSDDPDTPIANDPTRDVVGNMPLLYAEKRVALFVDLSSPGLVDPGDVLRYTITVRNSAAIPATGVVLRDSVPANTAYVADTTLLNGSPVGQPDGGVSPLASGININTIEPGATAELQFDLRVNAGTPAGTIISNQAIVDSIELPDLMTDGDGNPATGPEPTVVVVGNGQQVSITNTVAVVGGGAAVPGAELEYVLRMVNIAEVPAINVVITDDLDESQPGQIAYVNGSATMNGSAAGVTFAGSTVTANYSSISGPLAPGEVVVLRFRATINANLAVGTTVTNTGVVTWNQPTQTQRSSVSIVIGAVPGIGFAELSGSVWHDANFDEGRDSVERAMGGWTVDLYRNGQVVHSALTDAAGVYRISGVEPNAAGNPYELRFRAPGAGANTAMLGLAASPFTNGMQRIMDIVVAAGANLQGLNLPIHPNGVIYNSVARTPVAGATVTLLDAGSGTPLPPACFNDAAQQGQITLANGYYKFDINFSDPACPNGGNYLIGVTAPTATYMAGYSQIIPPASHASTAAFSVPACAASAVDAIQGTGLFCEVQSSELAPPASVAPRTTGTIHHIHMRLDGSQTPGSSQIFNNHIPLDPLVTGSLAISKTTPMINVTRGQLVPYVITVNNPAGQMLTDVTIVDRIPAGFNYVAGSALLDDVRTEPSITGLELRWNGLAIARTQARTVRLLLVVGGGVTEGEYVNRAQVMGASAAMSGEATATVRVMPDTTFDCTDVTGKVFNDANRNGVQNHGEDGLPGVRVVTTTGLQATTDRFGRFHVTCAITPNESRGSNFVLKLDDRTLPSGFRLTTDQLQIKRVTRGKALNFSFAASIHRVVGIDLSDAVFEPNKTEIRVHWRPRLNLLLEELRKAPAVLRLSYVADTEDAALVERRVEAVKRQLTEAWAMTNDSQVLTIEPQVFWRRGAPPKRPDVRVPKKR